MIWCFSLPDHNLSQNSSIIMTAIPLECETRIRYRNLVIWGLIVCGLALRLWYYLLDRGLWVDEASLAGLVYGKSIGDWFQYQNGQQVAPIGFMLMCKWIGGLFQYSDLAVRAVPLLVSAVAVIITPKAMAKYAREEAVVWACAFMALGAPLIEYATEFKPYGSDVLFSLVLMILLYWWRSAQHSWRSVTIGALVGAVSIWFSYPAVFVLAGVGGALFIELSFRRQWTSVKLLAGVIAVWLISFVTYYCMVLRHAENDTGLVQFHEMAFAPLPISMGGLQWYINGFLELFAFPIGFDFRWLALGGFLFVSGVRAVWIREPGICAMLLGPFAVTLLASALHRYPWTDRLLLFLAPFIAVILSEGLSWNRVILIQNWRAGSTILMAFIAMPLCLSAVRPIRSLKGIPNYKTHDVRGLLAEVFPKVGPEDQVFVYLPTAPAFRHYTFMKGYLWPSVIFGAREIDNRDPNGRPMTVEDVGDEILNKTVAGRTWIFLSHSELSDAQIALLRGMLGAHGAVSEPTLAHGAIALRFDRKN
jgi:hypothetical protein